MLRFDEPYSRVNYTFGATGTLGKSIHEMLLRDPAALSVSCSRGRGIADPSEKRDNEHRVSIGIDPAGALQMFAETVAGLQQGIPRTAVLVYPIGPFKFEGNELSLDPQTMEYRQESFNRDQEIFRINVVAFRELAVTLLNVCKSQTLKDAGSIHIKLVAFGSISDRYEPEQWRSYSESKNILRRYMRKCVNLGSDTNVPVSGIFINTSTIATEAERALRPNAPAEEKEFWLSPEEVARKTLEAVDIVKPGEFVEQDVFRPSPRFTPELYKPTARTLDRWADQMGIPRFTDRSAGGPKP